MIKNIIFASTLVFAFCSPSQGSNEAGHSDNKPADSQACVLNYPAFEVEVPHFDLMKCPESENVSMSEGICRLSIIGNKAFLYTFKLKSGSLCLSDAKEVPLADYFSD